MLPHNNSSIKIDLTGAAFDQIKLIEQNDYTLENLCFRLKIDGKGCDGFTYATGFSEIIDDDVVLNYTKENESLTIIIDPFAAHYCHSGTLDYIFSHKDDQDGFTFTNNNEALYKGKFFKDESMVPNFKSQS
jgi:iron-sulfur cluster assembly accessory protein